jgi:hypothetical protein
MSVMSALWVGMNVLSKSWSMEFAKPENLFSINRAKDGRTPYRLYPIFAENQPDNIRQILAFLAKRIRHDFSLYKSSTLKRRIGRRIAVTRSRDAAEYLKVLYKDQQEMQIYGSSASTSFRTPSRKPAPGIICRTSRPIVSSERLKRYFVKDGDHCRVKQEVREPVIFAEQNLLRDPPFLELDLLVCRNLLINLEPEARDRLIPLFHYTLKKHGILFLGNSETISRFPDLFEPLSKSHSIFRKKETSVQPQIHFPTGKTASVSLDAEGENENESPARTHVRLEKAVEDVLMQVFAPACVILNRNGEIVFTRGRTGKYLELAQGKPNLNIADMAREKLRFPLISALRRIKYAEGPIREKGLRFKTNSEDQLIDLTVKIFSQPPLKNGWMVVFEKISVPAEKRPKNEPKTEDQREYSRYTNWKTDVGISPNPGGSGAGKGDAERLYREPASVRHHCAGGYRRCDGGEDG